MHKFFQRTKKKTSIHLNRTNSSLCVYIYDQTKYYVPLLKINLSDTIYFGWFILDDEVKSGKPLASGKGSLSSRVNHKHDIYTKELKYSQVSVSILDEFCLCISMVRFFWWGWVGMGEKKEWELGGVSNTYHRILRHLQRINFNEEEIFQGCWTYPSVTWEWTKSNILRISTGLDRKSEVIQLY